MTFEENLEYVNSIGCHSPDFFSGVKYGGYHIQQNPIEFAHLLTFLQNNDIVTYAEIGSASGGFIRAIYEAVKFDIALMIDDGNYQLSLQEENIKKFSHKVIRHIEDSHSEIAKYYLNLFHDAYNIDFLWIDGDHSYDGVKKDIDMAIGIVDGLTLIGFHDIDCPHVPGVKKAYDEAIADGKLIEIQRWVEKPEGKMSFGIAVCRVV